jgi:pyridoxamine 5'-phosphate oxidase
MDPDLLAALRRQYVRPGLGPDDLDPDPLVALRDWLREAVEAAQAGMLLEPNAMVLSTSGPEGDPSSRTVLLKGLDDRGLVFYTNYTSRKARELTAHPRAALLFPWHPLGRQVIVGGPVARVDRAETEAYFRSRPRSSQLGAWASRQSSVVAARADLDDRFAALERRWPEGTEVPVPDFWGGFRLAPESVEFWQGRADRLHDRLRFTRTDVSAPWVLERLAP